MEVAGSSVRKCMCHCMHIISFNICLLLLIFIRIGVIVWDTI